MSNAWNELRYILDSIQRILEYTKEGKDAFVASKFVQDAVIRNLQVIGDAAKNIPLDFQLEHPQIPWRGMKSMRNVLVHDYKRIDHHLVWRVVEAELPSLRNQLMELLHSLEGGTPEISEDDKQA